VRLLAAAKVGGHQIDDEAPFTQAVVCADRDVAL
jgi:hypothetical protein